MTLTELAAESHIDRVLEAARHDCRDRRKTNMEGAILALQGAAADLTTFAGNAGISYLVAERLERLAAELASFRARDLLSMRAAS